MATRTLVLGRLFVSVSALPALQGCYTVVGDTERGCELHREVEALDMKLQPELVVALRSKGKTEADLANMQTDGYAQLLERNPKRLSCRFGGDELREVVLDLAEGKHEPRLWRDRCTAVQDEGEAAGAAKAPSAPTEPTEPSAPTAPAQAP